MAVAVAALVITPVPVQRYAATTKVLISQGTSGLPDADTVVREQRIADTYRVLRTNLEVTDSGDPIRTLVVTSGSSQEGKSTTATRSSR